MQITQVRIHKTDLVGKLKAIVSVTLDDEVVIHDIRLVEGVSGLFIAMPSRKLGAGGFKDIIHPVSSDVRKRFEEAVISRYYEVLEHEALENK
ncbi:MAG: septation regulator SpoVG [Bacillota bacterium]|nr:septation regulator SpoVG [Bacillota bacterium]